MLVKTTTAPTLGGKTAILAEFDRASHVAEFQRTLQKILRCRDNLVPDLLERLASADIPTAKKAAIALGYLRSPQALIPLVKSACDRRRQIHWQATAAIAQIGTPEAVAYLIQLLKHPASVQLQASAAKALGKCGVMAVTPLIDGLRCGDDLVKFHAAHSLGQIGSPLAVPDLINLLKHHSRHIRSEAVWALGQIRSPLSIASLAERLTDSDLGVQSQAAQALKNIGTASLPALTAMLKSGSSHTRSIAIRTLAQMGYEEVIPEIAHVLFHDPFPYVRSDAAQALGELGGRQAVYYLSYALKDGDRAVRSSAIRTLKRIGSPTAQDILRQIDPDWASQETTILQNRARFRVNDSDYTIIQ